MGTSRGGCSSSRPSYPLQQLDLPRLHSYQCSSGCLCFLSPPTSQCPYFASSVPAHPNFHHPCPSLSCVSPCLCSKPVPSFPVTAHACSSPLLPCSPLPRPTLPLYTLHLHASVLAQSCFFCSQASGNLLQVAPSPCCNQDEGHHPCRFLSMSRLTPAFPTHPVSVNGFCRE